MIQFTSKLCAKCYTDRRSFSQKKPSSGSNQDSVDMRFKVNMYFWWNIFDFIVCILALDGPRRILTTVRHYNKELIHSLIWNKSHIVFRRFCNSRIELALRILEPGKNWNINETFWFNTLWVSSNTKKKLTVIKNREDTFWGYFPRWPPSAILENEILIYWPYKYV